MNRDARIENSKFWWWQLRFDNINIEFTITKSSQDQFFFDNMLFKMYKRCILLNKLKYTWMQNCSHFSSSSIMTDLEGEWRFYTGLLWPHSGKWCLTNFICTFCIFLLINPLCKFSALPGRDKTIEGLSVCSWFKPEITLHNWA